MLIFVQNVLNLLIKIFSKKNLDHFFGQNFYLTGLRRDPVIFTNKNFIAKEKIISKIGIKNKNNLITANSDINVGTHEKTITRLRFHEITIQ